METKSDLGFFRDCFDWKAKPASVSKTAITTTFEDRLLNSILFQPWPEQNLSAKPTATQDEDDSLDVPDCPMEIIFVDDKQDQGVTIDPAIEPPSTPPLNLAQQLVQSTSSVTSEAATSVEVSPQPADTQPATTGASVSSLVKVGILSVAADWTVRAALASAITPSLAPVAMPVLLTIGAAQLVLSARMINREKNRVQLNIKQEDFNKFIDRNSCLGGIRLSSL